MKGREQYLQLKNVKEEELAPRYEVKDGIDPKITSDKTFDTVLLNNETLSSRNTIEPSSTRNVSMGANRIISRQQKTMGSKGLMNVESNSCKLFITNRS